MLNAMFLFVIFQTNNLVARKMGHDDIPTSSSEVHYHMETKIKKFNMNPIYAHILTAQTFRF